MLVGKQYAPTPKPAFYSHLQLKHGKRNWRGEISDLPNIRPLLYQITRPNQPDEDTLCFPAGRLKSMLPAVL
jgi:hypothetical protein